MSDITHTSPVVTEDKLTEFYEDIKPFLGCPAYITQEGNSDYYSSNEKVIGRWIDNKPLYQKTISLDWASAPSGNVDIFVDDVLQSASPIDGARVFGSYTIVSGANRLEINQPFMSSGISYYVVCQYVTSSGGNARNKISISHNIHPSWYPVHIDIIAQYTKTTDSAATTVVEDPNEYSTTEKIIGKWIDGKPLYQQTFSFRASSGWNTIDSSGNHSTWRMSMLKSIFVATSDGSFFGGNNSYGVLVNMPSTICGSSNFRVYCPSFSKNNVDSYITVQYTKTTD